MAMTKEQALALAAARIRLAGQGASASPTNAAPAQPQGDWQDVLSAGFTAGVEAVPFVGPQIMSGLNQVKAAVHNGPLGQGLGYEPTTADELATENKQLEEQHPESAFVGSIAGPTVALAPLGLTSVGARMLGLSGGLGSRVGFGAASGFGIAGGDALSRGDSLPDAAADGLVGMTVGGALPVAAKGAGWLRDLVLGRSAPKEAQNVARALRDDDVPVDQINQRLQAMGPDAMVMDLGPNAQAQAGAVASVPGPGQRVVREAVNTRRQGATQRVTDDVAQTVGSQPDIGALRDGIISRQSQAADPLYAAVRNIPLQNLPQLAAVSRTPLGRQALAEAQRLMANDGVTLPNGQFTVGLADYMKRALDDIASSSARAGNNNVSRQARNMTRAITSAIDPVVPQYRAARDAFAGPAQVLDAIESGSTVFTKEMSPPQLQRELANMSASERDGFLEGARAQIEAQMGNAVNDVATLRNTFRKGWNEAKLRILLGPQIADDLLRRIDRELSYGQTANAVTSNSETARRLASQGEVDPRTGTVAQPGKTFLGLLFDAFNAARNGIQGVRQPQINQGMARLQTQRQLSPEALRQLQNGSRSTAPAVLPPAGAATGVAQKREPIQITIGR